MCKHNVNETLAGWFSVSYKYVYSPSLPTVLQVYVPFEMTLNLLHKTLSQCLCHKWTEAHFDRQPHLVSLSHSFYFPFNKGNTNRNTKRKENFCQSHEKMVTFVLRVGNFGSRVVSHVANIPSSILISSIPETTKSKTIDKVSWSSVGELCPPHDSKHLNHYHWLAFSATWDNSSKGKPGYILCCFYINLPAS